MVLLLSIALTRPRVRGGGVSSNPETALEAKTELRNFVRKRGHAKDCIKLSHISDCASDPRYKRLNRNNNLVKL